MQKKSTFPYDQAAVYADRQTPTRGETPGSRYGIMDLVEALCEMGTVGYLVINADKSDHRKAF